MSNMSFAICLAQVLVVMFLTTCDGTRSVGLSSNEGFPPERGIIPQHGVYYENAACQEFQSDSVIGSGWLLEDCIDVWTSWAPTLGEGKLLKTDDRQFFWAVGNRLRQLGTPCLVSPPETKDGAGSRSMRHLATMVYAQDMGCDYLLPEGYQTGSNVNGSMYCHAVQYNRNQDLIKDENFRCAAVDWIEYFGFSDHMATFPDDRRDTKIINVRAR